MEDWFPRRRKFYNRVISVAAEVAAAHGFEEMSTPIVEHSAVFQRTLGEASDVVMKEMYTFYDRSEHLLTLRPENTAGEFD
jgi:histidyl-tRNA synthetase